MGSFPIVETAFTGFRVIRRNPKAFAIWMAAFFLLAIVFGFVFITQISPTLVSLAAVRTGASADPTASLALMQKMLPLQSIMFLITLVMYPVIYAAMNRAVLRPEDSTFGFLRVGSDEVLQFVLMIVCGAVFIGSYFVFIIGAVVIAVIAMAIAAIVGASGAVVAWIFGAAMGIGLCVAAALIVARLCLASAMTFATGKITFFASWSLTKGMTWRIIAVGLVCMVVTIVIYLAFGIVFAVLLTTFVNGAPGAFTGPAAVEQIFRSPAFVLVQLLFVPASAVMMPLWLTPPAEIYRRLTRLADVF